MMPPDWPDSPKYLTVQQLLRVLEGIEDKELRLSPNGVGNIAIDSADGSEFVGYIDFAQEGECNIFKQPWVYSKS